MIGGLMSKLSVMLPMYDLKDVLRRISKQRNSVVLIQFCVLAGGGRREI